jgi:hypothetical protein
VPALHTAVARFLEATAIETTRRTGVNLAFRLNRAHLGVDLIEDFASLGPVLTVPAVDGLGKVLRILRAARLARPSDPLALVGDPESAAALLARAEGTAMRLHLRSRFELRFIAWTDSGVETVEDVADVHEYEDAYYIHRRGARSPRRFERSEIVRHQTEQRRWHEVVDIERA